MSFDKIRALDDREQAREKLPIFFGSRDNYLHGFREVCLNNTIDEISNNFDNGDIFIELHEDDKTITVKDTGRGMPINEESDGIPNWKLFFTKLFASGKYDISDGENSGVNGVGGTVLQYSSLLYSVISCYNGKKYMIEFENGGDIKTPLTYLGETKEHGTQIIFKLDPQCYTKVTYDYKDLIDMINKVSSVSPKTNIHFKYKDKEFDFHYDNLSEYYKKNINDKEDIFNFECNKKVYEEDVKKELLYTDAEIEMHGGKQDYQIIHEITKIECIFSTSTNPIQEAYLNRNYLVSGGSINDGIIDGVKQYCHKYIKRKGLYLSKEKSISFDDVKNTISFVVNVLSNNVEFESQTKFSTKKTLYNKIAKQFIQEYLEIFEVENRDEFQKLIEQILLTKRVNEKAEENRKNNRKKLEDKAKAKKPFIAKLADCTSKNPRECEIFLLEGDSAGGNAKQARDRRIQACLPQRGKSKNVIKGGDNAIDSEVLKDIKEAIGFEYGDNYDSKDLHYWKIILTADADTDGSDHIVPLWLTYFYDKVPKLIEEGHLYISVPPLYKNDIDKNKSIYTYTEEEQLKFLKDNKPRNIQRYKGLNHLELAHTYLTSYQKVCYSV